MANGGNNSNAQHYDQQQGQQEYYAQLQQQQQQQQQQQPPLQNDSHSVILVTAGYDNTIRFWEALSGICSRTIKHPDSVGHQQLRFGIDRNHTYQYAFGGNSKSIGYAFHLTRLRWRLQVLLAGALLTPTRALKLCIGNHSVRLYDVNSPNENPVSIESIA